MSVFGKDPGAARIKFAPYVNTFAAYLLTFCVFCLLGAALWNGISVDPGAAGIISGAADRLRTDSGDAVSAALSGALFPASLIAVAFAAGPTTYSPAIGFLGSLFYGLREGLSLGLRFRLVSMGLSPGALLSDAFFELAAVPAVMAAFSFCCRLCLRKMSASGRRPALFGGSLFCFGPSRFPDLRFIFTYLAFFVLFEIPVYLISFVRIGVISLILFH